MNLKKIAILSFACLLTLSMGAQKKKKRVAKKPVVEEPQEDPRITNMREMTQQIIIIDSIVVESNKILPYLHLSSETGQLMMTSDFLDKAVSGYAFVNEMGNKAYLSMTDNQGLQQIYTCDLLGGEWSQPQQLQGINDGILEASYPFMLTDGLTFYFAGKGEESIGGYDIFFTRYDVRNGRFFKPENIGMPFNSEANDYLYAVDEQNRIGYFISDRRQPEGYVCIYIFIPSENRKTYDAADYNEQQIRDLADILHIADTWGDGKERKAALERLKTIGKETSKASVQSPSTDVNHLLVINDAHTYSGVNDFRSKEASALYQKLVKARQTRESFLSQLERSRNNYAQAVGSEKQSLRREILQAENDLQQLNDQIRTLEKQAREAEIKVIN